MKYRIQDLSALAGLLVPVYLALAPAPETPTSPAIPFAVGEELVYQARAGRFGTIGRGTMRIGGTEVVRGHRALMLQFDFRGRFGLARVSDHTRSWLCSQHMATFRYHKREQSPVFSTREEAEVYPEERRWESPDGGGQSPTDVPLDELSFIYFIRTLPLKDGEVHTLNRHFDTERNPVTVRVIGREMVTVPVGQYRAIVVEMGVKDRRQKGGRGVVRLHLSDDAYRLPVRIESPMPLVGTSTLLLESITLGSGGSR